MIRIDSTPNVQPLPQIDNNQQQGQVATTTTTSAMIAHEFMDSSNESLTEAMEEMSIGIGSNIRRMMKAQEKELPQLKALENLLREMDDEQAATVGKLAAEFLIYQSADEILAQAQLKGLSDGQLMLLLSTLIISSKLGEEELKKLREALQELVTQDGAELVLFSAMEEMPLTTSGFASLRELYQRAQRGEEGLSNWFARLKDLPDRRRRIKVLLRALSEPLSTETGKGDITRLAAVVHDLRRLLIFLTIEEHSIIVAKFFQIDSEAILQETLHLIEQTWLYMQLIEESLLKLGLPESRKAVFLQRWRGLISMVHSDCFRDQDHKEHIDEIFIELLDKLAAEE